MQTLFYKEYDASRRRVYIVAVSSADGNTVVTTLTGTQLKLSKLGAAPSATGVGVLVATDASEGLYYTELDQSALDTIGRHRITGLPAGVAIVDELVEVVPHPFLHDGLAAGGGSNVITLAAGASAVDDAYTDAFVSIYDGTGAGQTRQVSGYVGATKTATVDQPWLTQPDATSKYLVEPGPRLAALTSVFDADTALHTVAGSFGEVLQPTFRGVAQAGGSNTVTLPADASPLDSFYKGSIVRIVAGTGAKQSNIIAGYVGATKVATVAANWAVVPDNSSVLLVLPFGTIPGATAPTAGEVADAVWDEALAAHVIAGSFGAGVRLEAGTLGLIADALLARSVGGGEDTQPNVKFALCFLAGKWTDNGDGTITVYDVDDTTALGTINYSTRARDAIGGIDSSF